MVLTSVRSIDTLSSLLALYPDYGRLDAHAGLILEREVGKAIQTDEVLANEVNASQPPRPEYDVLKDTYELAGVREEIMCDRREESLRKDESRRFAVPEHGLHRERRIRSPAMASRRPRE